MSIVELIGFVVSLFGLFFLFGRDRYIENQKKKDPEKYARRERLLEEQLRQMGVSFEEQEDDDEEDEEIEEEMLPPPLPVAHRTPISQEKPMKMKAAPQNVQRAPSAVDRFIRSVPDKRYLLVSHILFGPPKGLDIDEKHR